jgi:hypothetical protein
LRERVCLLVAQALDDEIAHHLLHVSHRFLGDVREDQGAVVQALDRFLPDHADERGRRQVAELWVDRAKHGGGVHQDLVRGKCKQGPARNRVMRYEHRHLRGVALERVGNLLRRQDEPAGSVQEKVDRCVVVRQPDRRTASESSMSMKR